MASWPREQYRPGVGHLRRIPLLPGRSWSDTRLVLRAISSRAFGRHQRHALVSAPGMIQLKTGGAGHARLGPPPPRGAEIVDGQLVPNVKRGTGTRGKVRGWTADSIFEFMKACARIEWPGRPLVFITLTYPGEFTHDARAWKEHLRRFAIAWGRQWGEPLGVWAMEFQGRGAPHFHLAMVLPKGLAIETITGGSGAELRVAPWALRKWVAETWYALAGNGDERHRNQHLKREHCKPSDRKGILGYLQRELGKGKQKTLPAWLEETGAGRWWGKWGLRDASVSEPVTHEEYQRLHRVAKGIGRARTKADLAAAHDDMTGWHCAYPARGRHIVTISDADGHPIEVARVRSLLARVQKLRDRLDKRRRGKDVYRRAHEWKTLFDQSRGQWRLADEFRYYLRRMRRVTVDPLTLPLAVRVDVRASFARDVDDAPIRSSFLALERSILDLAQQLSLWAAA